MKKMNLLRGFFNIVILSIVLIFVSSCNSCNSKKDDTLITVGYIPIADCSQLFVAVEKGFFKDEGLNVKIQEFQGGPQILEALGGNKLEIGFSNLISLIKANENGINFRAVTGGPVEEAGHVENAILILKSSGINVAKDLEGKKVAVNSRKNIIELMVREYLLKNGADPEKVEIVEMKFPQMQAALIAKQIDAMANIEPFVTIGMKDTSIKVLSYYFTNVLPRLEISSYHGNLKWLQDNENLVKKFKNAMVTATKYCNENPNEVRSVLIKYANKGNPAILKEAVLPSFTKELSQDNLQVLIEKMQKNSWLSKNIIASDLIYNFKSN
jgi:NitT/TauT family transport system substrate-binding protein